MDMVKSCIYLRISIVNSDGCFQIHFIDTDKLCVYYALFYRLGVCFGGHPTLQKDLLIFSRMKGEYKMSEMNVTGTAGATGAYTGYQNTAKTKDAAKTSEKKAESDGAVYEKTKEADKKATYSINKMSSADRAKLVEQLKLEEVNRRNQLSGLVQKMFNGQANVSKLADLFSPENLKNVSAEDIAQAKADVAEDGYWGVKQTSQRLFDFASALAGDDPEKMKEMQAAMEKGFKQATKAWGTDLPDLCKDTLDAANKLFDDYYASKKAPVE